MVRIGSIYLSQTPSTRNRKDIMDKNTHAPVVVDLGSRGKKAIRNLKNGTGALMVEVDSAIDHVRSTLPDTEKNKTIIPVVLIYRRKKRRGRMTDLTYSPLNPFSFLRC